MSSPVRPKTVYRLSRGPRDRRRVHECMRAWGLGPLRLGDPLLLAWREDKIVGFLSTRQKPLVHISQLAVLPQTGAKRAVASLAAFRLLEEYERILRHLGLTSYYFHIDCESGSWADTMEGLVATQSFGITEYRRVASGTWYNRRFSGRPVHSEGRR